MMKIDFFVCVRDASEYVFLTFLGVFKDIWSIFECFKAYFQPRSADFWLLECISQVSELRNPHLSASGCQPKMAI